MKYRKEELVQIVARLAEKYTAKESTSISYETAQQLMGAVMYCIREYEASQRQSFTNKHLIRLQENSVSAMAAYETGAALVEQKVKSALQIYNELMNSFSDYENICLHDIVVKGLPEFFRWYDCRFEPQNTILTLDYPVIMDLSAYTGIDRIYEYILCIRSEQIFLKKFSQQFVMDILEKYSKRHRAMIDNLCEIVLMNICGHILTEKRLNEVHFDTGDYQILLEKAETKSLNELNIFLKKAIETMIQEYYENDKYMTEYLCKAADNIAVRIKNAAENDALQRLF